MVKAKSIANLSAAGKPSSVSATPPAPSTALEVHIDDLRNVYSRLITLNTHVNAFRARVYGEGAPDSEGGAKAAASLPHVQEINSLQQGIFEEINRLEDQVASFINFLG